MAGWDKIRAAAQRPDCIFSAFPDGEAGAMYHPRSSADLKLTAEGGAKIENGVFVNPMTNKNNSQLIQPNPLKGVNHDLTIIAKFSAEVPAGSVYWFFAPFIMGSIGGQHWGIGWQGATQTFDGETFKTNVSCRFEYQKTDGTTASTMCSTQSTFTCGDWHTFAMTLPFEDVPNGMIKAYADGTNIYNFLIRNLTKDLNAIIIGTMNTSYFDSICINQLLGGTDKVCKCRTAWAMAFNRYLSEEEIKYLSED